MGTPSPTLAFSAQQVSFASTLAVLPRPAQGSQPLEPHSYRPNTQDPRPAGTPSIPGDKPNLVQVGAPSAQGQSSYLDLPPGSCS